MKILSMTVLARSNKDEVEEISPTEFVVRVKAEPTKGHANKEALKALARHLGIPFAKLMPTKNDGDNIKTVMVIE